MRKNESGVMLLESIYILPVFMILMLLFYTVLPIIEMTSAVDKAAVNTMMSLSQDPAFTEIIRFQNSTTDMITGVGDAIERGVASNGSLIKKNSQFVDSTRWYYNDKITTERTIYTNAKSAMDAAIKREIKTYADGNRDRYCSMIAHSLMEATTHGWFSYQAYYIGSLSGKFYDDFVSELEKYTGSATELTEYLDTLEKIIGELEEGKTSDFYSKNFNVIEKYAKAEEGKKEVIEFWVTRYASTEPAFAPQEARALLTKAQYQTLYDDLKEILDRNATSYKQTIQTNVFDNVKTRDVAQRRFVAYLTGKDDFKKVEDCKKYQEFTKRFEITKTKKERLNDVKKDDYGFDFDSTEFDSTSEKLVLNIKYHVVYGINLFNQVLPQDYEVQCTTKMWPGNKKIKKETEQKAWTVNVNKKDTDTTPPTWAAAK
ncbi:MAG: hypothetical protein LBN08_06605 [Lactobacillales bacterium]|jgi:hypothetical protein|nr:hypothetical protein [Lactobacillales bacterium]